MRAAGCQHCLHLALAVALDPEGLGTQIAPLKTQVPQLPSKYGFKFEDQIEADFVSALPQGQVQKPDQSLPDQFAATIELMKQGVPVIYQGTLEHLVGNTKFNGRPDFLIRADYTVTFVGQTLVVEPNGQGLSDHYFVLDAKLAANPKPENLLQVGLYIDALLDIGFNHGGQHGLIMGNRTVVLFDQIDLLPATREARKKIELAAQRLAQNQDRSWLEWQNLEKFCPTAALCKKCDYEELCVQQRHAVDHLQLVANIRKDQIAKLKQAGIQTMSQLAYLDDSDCPSDLKLATFIKLRNQALVQTETIRTGKPVYRMIENPAILVMPPASEGDIFFDMEGFPYYRPGGLEYLFGSIIRNGQETEFIPFWAHDRQAEAKAFADFVDFAVERLRRYPSAHVYHYASYEVSAMTNLSERHGIKAQEVEWLLESNKFVDLYKMVTNSIFAGFEGYSIKKLEAFYPQKLTRSEKVKNAGDSIVEYDLYREAIVVEPEGPEAKALLEAIYEYNKDDCVSTLHLYNWLSELPGASSQYQEWLLAIQTQKLAREDQAQSQPGDSGAEQARAELERIQLETDQLLAKAALVESGANPEIESQLSAWLALAHSMMFYKREAVAFWLRVYILTQALPEDLDRDRKGLAIDSVDFDGQEYTYQLGPNQTHFFKADDKIFVRYPLMTGTNTWDFGTVRYVTQSQVVFTRKLGPGSTGAEPNGIFANDLVTAGSKQMAVANHARKLTNLWQDPTSPIPENSAVLDLLLRRKPNLAGQSLPSSQQDSLESTLIDAVFKLNNSTLAIQGPPGSGKTYLASRAIRALQAAGKKVGVVANSHSAVENLLLACIEAGVPTDAIAKRRNSKDRGRNTNPWQPIKDSRAVEVFKAQQKSGFVVGGTAWNLTSDAFLALDLDYIFIDEAAQFSLVDAIGVGIGTKNLVLLGDPMQLTQVVQAVHPGGVDNSALGHYMGENDLLPADSGYFVSQTRRMHPKVNQPVSWLAYQGKLSAHASTSQNVIPTIPVGLIAVPVEHQSNSSHSPQEVSVAVELAQRLAAVLDQDQIMVIAPFNAQVDLLGKALKNAGLPNIPVGTVDKFQGKEAMAVVYSLSSSSAADTPRGLEFVLNRNRLNVAISRAKATAYLIYSPELLSPDFNSVEDLKGVSRLLGTLSFANHKQE
jgi:predicted RecB family nuclease